MERSDGESRKSTPGKKKRASLVKLWREERYAVLLASLFIYIILSVLLPRDTWGAATLDIIFLILVLSVVFEVARLRSLFSILGLFGLVAVLGHGFYYFCPEKTLGWVILSVSSILFVMAAIVRVSRDVLNSRVVKGDTIRGAIIIYLFIGVLFTSVFVLIETLMPGSFLVTNSAGKPLAYSTHHISRLFGYFSMVTLTTLGYGDIVPVKELSRTLAWIEAFTGQVYLAVIIARLVGIYITQSGKKSS